ncbi:MAG: hypothetical protein KF745_02640 [Phycisphaeraceae bacterium]|nr:hypothetical protein [Phycisphaeraceae bacterium]
MIGDGLLDRINKFAQRVRLSNADLWAIVELNRFMADDVRRPPTEADVEACCRHVGADANKVLLFYFGARPGRWWRWMHRVRRER